MKRLRKTNIKPKGAPASEVPWPPPVGSEVRYVIRAGHHANRLYYIQGHVDWLIVAVWWNGRGWYHQLLDPGWWEISEDLITVVMPDQAQQIVFDEEYNAK